MMSLILNDEELATISEISDAVLPLQVAVEALCRRDANLITADAVLMFALQKLEEQDTGLSLNLHATFPPVINRDVRQIFASPSRKKIETLILQLIKRCHSDDASQADDDPKDDNDANDETSKPERPKCKKKKKTALHIELDNAIKKALTSKSPPNTDYSDTLQGN
ncbi:hypothetical protein Bhyg_08750 [Pseudolycoriella hygida]|uniref:Uncharacterized protein n=1 Tax=Pseudolycoriella hygida TaxID=35572 RepID=A0A9Q0S591_9DIPT|nr:hypothetical protein Bhyg_08750 [Pseudolycoriella hygida]